MSAADGSRLCEMFHARTTAAYDINDVLDTFWTFAVPLVESSISDESIGDNRRILQAVVRLDAQTWKQRGFLAADFESLARIAAMCDRGRLVDLRNAFLLYLATIRSIGTDPPAQCWCQASIQAHTCPLCGREGRYRLWNVINTALRPDLASAARSGQLCDGEDCHYCGHPLGCSDFLYCDPIREEFLVFWPFDDGNERDEAIERYWRCLAQMPPEVRGGKTQIVYVDGMPCAVFAEGHVAGMTCVKSKEEFLEVVMGDVYFNAEPNLDLDAMEDYFAARTALDEGNWAGAASSLARFFVRDPVRPSDVQNVARCLHNMGRTTEAEALQAWGQKLFEHLVQGRIIVRIVRRGVPYDGGNTALHFQIRESGFPAEWSMGDLMAAMTRIAAET